MTFSQQFSCEGSGSTLFYKADNTGTGLQITLAADTPIPTGATHFLVYPENENGEYSGTPQSHAFYDAYPPLNLAEKVTYKDSAYHSKLTVFITAATDESDIDNYVVYFGKSATQTTGAALAEFGPGGGTFQITADFGFRLGVPADATHILVITRRGVLEMGADGYSGDLYVEVAIEGTQAARQLVDASTFNVNNNEDVRLSEQGFCIMTIFGEYSCACFPNWQGADCSERICPYGLAFADAPTGTDTAHTYAECSNKGVCNRVTGECECYPGYEGKGCRRNSCPNECSGKGTCRYIEELSTRNGRYEVNYDNMQSYDSWDKSKYQACVCDPGYEGTDCSLRICPKGDNVLTLKDFDTVQEITLVDSNAATPHPSGEITISWTDLFGATFTTRPIAINSADDSTDIENALKSLPNGMFEDVTVTVQAQTAAGATVNGYVYRVEFPDLPHNHGQQNLLQINTAGCNRAGCTPIYAGLSSSDNGVVAAVTDVTGTVQCSGGSCYKEAAECSEHGLCDHQAGICECFPGFIGNACEEQLPIA
jgi:hypothetical protein